MSDYLTPGGSPTPGMEGRRAIYISSERDRIAKLMAQDALEQAAGLAERENAAAPPGRIPRRTTAVAAADALAAQGVARRRRDRRAFIIGFAAGFVLGGVLMILVTVFRL